MVTAAVVSGLPNSGFRANSRDGKTAEPDGAGGGEGAVEVEKQRNNGEPSVTEKSRKTKKKKQKENTSWEKSR